MRYPDMTDETKDLHNGRTDSRTSVIRYTRRQTDIGTVLVFTAYAETGDHRLTEHYDHVPVDRDIRDGRVSANHGGSLRLRYVPG